MVGGRRYPAGRPLAVGGRRARAHPAAERSTGLACRAAERSGTIVAVMRRLLWSLPTAAALLLLSAPAALAMNNGRGFYGATDDKVVTTAGFILIVFFPTFVLLASLLQKHLEKRKDARVAAAHSHADGDRFRGGW